MEELLEKLSLNLDEINSLARTTDEFRSICYLLYKEIGDNPKKINEVCNALKIKPDHFMRIIDKYKSTPKNSYQEMQRAWRKKEQYIKTGYIDESIKDFLKELSKAKSDSDIISVFTKYHNNYRNTDGVWGYIANLYPNKKEATKLYEEYQTKRIIYRDYLKNIRMEELKLEKQKRLHEFEQKALKFAKIILKDDEITNSNDILNKYNISYTIYEKLRSVWIQHDLYEKIREKITYNRNQALGNKYNSLIAKILPLTDKNSIAFGKIYRTLDVFDCYTYFGDDLPFVLETCRSIFKVFDDENKTLNQERLARLKIILTHNVFGSSSKHSNGYNVNEEEVIDKFHKEVKEVDYQKIDDDGLVVPGSGHLLTIDEKDSIINTLKAMNIPLNSQTLNEAAKRYHNGHLELITKDTIDEYISESKNKKTK